MASLQVLLTTAYFPPVSWFASLLLTEKVKLEACETYLRQSYRNRCCISGPNGKQALIIPVNKPGGNHTRITEIIIPANNNWRTMHWRAIITAYNKSPFFLYYRDQIEKVLFFPETNLFNFNLSVISQMINLFEIDKEIGKTLTFEKRYSHCIDLRNLIHPKKTKFGNDFFPGYTQVYSTKFGFQPDLSALDLLFNEGPASIDYLSSVCSRIKNAY